MSRLHFVKKAAKDYPKQGIAKGDSYYWWQNYRMPRQLSKERPRPSRYASSEYERSVLALVEGLEDFEEKPFEAWGEMDRDDLITEIELIRDGEQEKFDNMPEGLQQGDTGLLIEERIAALDEWISELGNIDFEGDNPTPLEQALASAIGV